MGDHVHEEILKSVPVLGIEFGDCLGKMGRAPWYSGASGGIWE